MSDSTNAPTPTEALLDLAQPRTIVLDDRGHQYVLHCRRITPADWTAFFRGITVTSENDGRDRINVVDAETPRLALAESVLIGAEGYKVAGGAELTSLDNWQKRIPLAHRLQLGAVLADARPSTQSDELTIYAEVEVVLLDSTWTASKSEADGVITLAMHRIEGLKHVFAAPSEEQHRRYKREGSRVRVVGGSRNGKTVYPGANALLGTLYDELIQSVEGYSYNGAPVADRSQAIAQMDMHHKIMAVQELFEPRSMPQLAGGEEG